MDTFIRNDQYNYIKMQAKNLVNGHSSAQDEDVLRALKAIVLDRILSLFPKASEKQSRLLQSIVTIKDKEMAQQYLVQLKPFRSPLKVTETEIEKLFSKVKKFKAPKLNDYNLNEISYLSWIDQSNKKYLVTRRKGQLVGVRGSFDLANKKAICTICNRHSDVGLFLAKEKGKDLETYTKRGNYICVNSQDCNEHLTSLDKLYEFLLSLKQK